MPPACNGSRGHWGALIAVGVCVVVLGACALALWIVDTEGRKRISEQEREAVSVELDLFDEILTDEGLDGLVRSVERFADLESSHSIYALRDGNGRILAGALNSWPRGLASEEDWTPVTAEGFTLDVATRDLGDGIEIMIGRDRNALEQFQSRVTESVWLAIALVATACLLAGLALSSYIFAKVRSLSGVAARVSAGDFSARAPDAADNGPFGQIAHAQNLMLDRIEDLVTGLQSVTDSLAHDLRTPLGQLRRRIDDGLLADTSADKQAALEDASLIVDRTISTFTALIDIARADGGLSKEAMTPVELGRLLLDVQSLFEPMAEDREQTLTLVEPAPVVLKGHKPLLMQAVSNLVHNAIKYSPRSGRIDISMHETTGFVEIVVADSGPGIPADKRGQALQRFHRVSPSEENEGHGLGLSIVEACARLHGGRVVLEDNNPGLKATLVLAREA